MRKTFVVLAILLTGGLAQAQSFKDNFFYTVHFALWSDFMLSPSGTEYRSLGRKEFVNGRWVQVDDEITTRSFIVNSFSAGMELRYNIHTPNDSTALAIGIPWSFGYGEITDSPFKSGGDHAQGYGSLQIPVLLKLYKGSGSTYKCNHDFGMSFGLGAEYSKINLVKEKFVDYPDAGITSYVTPVATIGFHFWVQRTSNELRLKFGHGFSVDAPKSLRLSLHTMFDY